jgi:uncharacterized protein
MKVLHPLTAEQTREKAGDWLEQNEVQNNLILGILSSLLSKSPADRQEHHFWVVENEGAVIGAAFWTPPYKFTITAMEKDALMALANEVRNVFPNIPGIGGPKEAAKHFSHFWNLKTQKSPVLEMSMRIYQLDRVEPVPVKSGAMRAATMADRDLLVEWTKGLNQDAGLDDPTDPREIVESYIRAQKLFLWEDGGPKGMAGYGRNTPSSFSVNMVYTPPEFRKKGYATSLVAALSRKILDSGKKYCLLYTDLFNPTSNNIYQKMGYKPACDWNAYLFK